MKTFRKALIWSVLNDKPHKSLTEEDKQISAYMPIIDAMFPGINYYSVSGYFSVRKRIFKPALEKLFPEIKSASEDEIHPDDEIEVQEVLPSQGYEWQDSSEWEDRFNDILSAA